jgi:hypothetical protein
MVCPGVVVRHGAIGKHVSHCVVRQ